LSQRTLTEFTTHPARTFAVPEAETRAAEGFLRRHAEIVEPASVPTGPCRDPEDLAVPGTALSGRADALVTGDRDLPSLREFQGIPILSPRSAYDCIR
jgi:predicted nucleic acid-binding protein